MKTEGARALSIRQPWMDAILYGGKRIENRVAWQGSAFRGPVLLHAAKAMTLTEYNEAILFMMKRGIKWRPKLPPELTRGAIVGRAEVIDVIRTGGVNAKGDYHVRRSDPWYMDGFALELSRVEVFPEPIPYRGMLGFFPVDLSEHDRFTLEAQDAATVATCLCEKCRAKR